MTLRVRLNSDLRIYFDLCKCLADFWNDFRFIFIDCAELQIVCNGRMHFMWNYDIENINLWSTSDQISQMNDAR